MRKQLSAAWHASPAAAIAECVTMMIWVYCAVVLPLSIASGDFLAAAGLATAMALTAWSLFGWLRSLRRQGALRAEFIAAVRAIAGDAPWLSRDARMIFLAHQDWRGLRLNAASEEDFMSINEDGSGAIIWARYVLPPASDKVWRITDGDHVTIAPDGEPVIADDGKGLLRNWLDAVRLLRVSRTGRMDATPDELRTLLAQLRQAERLDTAP